MAETRPVARRWENKTVSLFLLKHVPSMWALSPRHACCVTLFHLCTSDQTQNGKCCHGNKEQSRRRLNKDYGSFIFAHSS